MINVIKGVKVILYYCLFIKYLKLAIKTGVNFTLFNSAPNIRQIFFPKVYYYRIKMKYLCKYFPDNLDALDVEIDIEVYAVIQ